MEISDLLNREFKIVIKMFIKVRKTMHEQVRISAVTEHIKRYQTNHKLEEHNNSIENFNRRVREVTRARGKRTSELEDRAVISIQLEDQKRKNEKSKDSVRGLRNTIRGIYIYHRGLRRRGERGTESLSNKQWLKTSLASGKKQTSRFRKSRAPMGLI